MSVEDKFNAAVAVIRSLPKEGPMNPSQSDKLKFYSFFKQAKEGKNTAEQPWAVQLEARAKWNAWDALGDMSKEDAMKKYAEGIFAMFNTGSDEEIEAADENIKTAVKAFLAIMKK